LVRNTTVGYGDGISTPGGSSRPSARAISNIVSAQGVTDLPSGRFLSGLVFQWGQFLDHDLDLSTTHSSEPFPIPVPPDDPFLDPLVTPFIFLSRSNFDTNTGTAGIPREQINDITSYIDGSMVYGSHDARARALRSGVGGRLLTSEGDLMPFNTLGLPNANPAGLPDDQLFVAGDIRSNETIALAAIHTLFVREHNFWADKIAAENPVLTDEEIYQQARRIVGAEIQVITYNEFLPAVLGYQALPEYRGYDPTVNAGVSNVFAAAGFRVGHTMLPVTLLRLGEDGNPIPEGNVALRDAFFRPDRLINEGGVDPILRGLMMSTQQEIDSKVVDEVRNFLFDNPSFVVANDLAALNVQRGRDHGLPSYNQARADFGLAAVTSFAEISSDPAVQEALEAAYGDVDSIDTWIGGICEDHLPGSSMGALFTAIWRDQFIRARDGDRFWYQNQFSGDELARLERTTLAEIIERNTGIVMPKSNAMLVPRSSMMVSGGVGADVDTRAFDTMTGAEEYRAEAYVQAFTGEVRVAIGDVNGDGVNDVITGAGPGGGPHVHVMDGRSGMALPGLPGNFFAYSPAFTGGIFVAAGDFNGDGRDDIVTGADAGGGPHVRVFDGATGNVLGEFFAYLPFFSGGVRVATGDVDGDGDLEIITSPGPGMSPMVRVFEGPNVSLFNGQSTSILSYASTFRGGLYVAAGDVNGDQAADIITGAGASGGPHVRVFSGVDCAPLMSFFAYGAFTGGVRVAAGDADLDGIADIITGAGPGGGPHVRVFHAMDAAPLASFFAYSGNFSGGLFVAGDRSRPTPASLAPGGMPALLGMWLPSSGDEGAEASNGFGGKDNEPLSPPQVSDRQPDVPTEKTYEPLLVGTQEEEQTGSSPIDALDALFSELDSTHLTDLA
jgi:hypothetical protein